MSKNIIKFGSKVNNLLYSNDKILLITDTAIKILNDSNLSPLNSIPNSSKFQSIHRNRIVTAGEEIRVINFQDDLLLTKFLSSNITSIAHSSLLIAIGKENGSLSIHSIISGKNLINLNLYKTKISNISFYSDTKILVQSKNFIRGTDVVEKKIEFKFNDNSDITFFTIADKNCFIANKKQELKIYDIEKDCVINSISVRDCIKSMKYYDDLLFLLYENYGIDALNINSLELISIDNDKFSIFDVNNKKLVAIDEEYNIVQYDLEAVLPKECIDADKDEIKFLTADDSGEEIKKEDRDKDKIKFLTVDDSLTMRLITKHAITNNFNDVVVYEAEDGIKCLEILENNPKIDVIFMDWNMPNMNGSDTVDKIRENPEYDHIKIIMATTEGAKDKVKEMINKGVKGYLIKPFESDSVVTLVKKMIEIVKEERDV